MVRSKNAGTGRFAKGSTVTITGPEGSPLVGKNATVVETPDLAAAYPDHGRRAVRQREPVVTVLVEGESRPRNVPAASLVKEEK